MANILAQPKKFSLTGGRQQDLPPPNLLPHASRLLKCTFHLNSFPLPIYEVRREKKKSFVTFTFEIAASGVNSAATQSELVS